MSRTAPRVTSTSSSIPRSIMRAVSSSCASTSVARAPLARSRGDAALQRSRRHRASARANVRAGARADPFADPVPRRTDVPDVTWRTTVEIGAGKRSDAFEGDALEIRAFGGEDVGEVAKLLLESGMQGFPTERRTLEVYLTNAIGAFPYGTYLVGTLRGEIVATVGVSFTQETRRKFSSLAPPSDGGYLSDLTVAVDKRGAGLGAAMLKGAESFARAMKSEEMWLHVALKKPGVIALYKDHGYTLGGVDPGLFGWRGRLLLKRKMSID